MDVQNSVVFITGANRGIGKAYVEGFLTAGAQKIYLAVRNTDSVADIVATNPDKLIPIELDVTNQNQVDAAAKAAQDTNILINNAGVLYWNSIKNASAIDEARKEMDVNYFGVMAVTQTFAPILKANGGGAIASLSSIAGHLSFPGLPTYSASKAAVHSLIMATRLELADQGTLVVGVYPGPIDTDMAADIEMEKAPPSQVAETTIAAIKNGHEDVFTDEMSKTLYQSVKTDPKAVEAEMLEMYRESQKAA